MGVSSKRVFKLRVPIGYEFLKSTADVDKNKKRKHNRRNLRMGRLGQKGQFIAGICRRFRVRVVRSCSCRWGSLLLKGVKGFYRSFLTGAREARPALKELNNSSAVFYPPAFKDVFLF